MGEIGEIITGNTPSKSNEEYYGNKYPFFKPTDLDSGYFVTEAQDNLSIKGFEISRKLPIKSILVTCIGATIGKTGFIRREGTCNQQINAIIASKLIFSEYIYLLCISPYFQNEIIKNASATTLPIINKSKFEKLFLPLPPLSEQRRIVEKIEELLALVDDLEANKTDLQSYIKQAKSKVLEMAIRGELVPQNPEDEPASILLERIKKEQKSSKSKGKTTEHNTHYEEELPFDIPENWALTRMENICQLLDGEKKQGVELPYLDVKFLRGKIEGEIKESGKYIPKNTHLILVDGENSGEIFKAQQDGYQGSTLKILNISEEICKKYIFYILKKEQKLFKESKTGSAIPHLNKKLFNDLLIFLPPLAEQYRIVEKIEHIFAVLEELEKNIL